MTEKPLGIYVHVPFCRRKCFYCDFLSWAERESDLERYVSCLEDEIVRKHLWQGVAGASVASVYFGGGTPSLLTPQQIEVLLKCIRGHFSLQSGCEITVEVNPESASQRFLEMAHQLGVNRLSIGAQSFVPSTLTVLGRLHTVEQTLRTFRTAREIGFNNISLDLIFGCPNETMDDLKESVVAVMQLRPEHLSTYSLGLEPRTPLALSIAAATLPELDEELMAEKFEHIICILTSAGYEHYEISNFALPGFQSRHNRNYWESGDYLGLGCGAHSHLRHERFRNSEDIAEYLTEPLSRVHRSEVEILDQDTQAREGIMLGLRLLNEGVNLARMRKRFGDAAVQNALDSLDEQVQNGLLSQKGDCIRLTQRGLFLADEVLACLI